MAMEKWWKEHNLKAQLYLLIGIMKQFLRKEIIQLPHGDTTDVGTSTVATNFGVSFEQCVIKLHLSEAKSE